jgi:hypothetical protein
MTDEERKREAAEEQIEDLEAPAEAQGDVVGGANTVINVCVVTCAVGRATRAQPAAGAPNHTEAM